MPKLYILIKPLHFLAISIVLNIHLPTKFIFFMVKLIMVKVIIAKFTMVKVLMAKLAIAKLTLYGKINNDSTNYGLMNHNS